MARPEYRTQREAPRHASPFQDLRFVHDVTSDFPINNVAKHDAIGRRPPCGNKHRLGGYIPLLSPAEYLFKKFLREEGYSEITGVPSSGYASLIRAIFGRRH